MQIANCAYAVYARSAIELVANVFYTPTTSMGWIIKGMMENCKEFKQPASNCIIDWSFHAIIIYSYLFLQFPCKYFKNAIYIML